MKPLTAIITAVLFAGFGYISAAQKDNNWLLIAFAIALGLTAIFILQLFLKWNLGPAPDSSIITADALESGVLFMIPFAVLALLADVWLGWHSSQAFLSAGLSAIAITSSSVLLKNGGTRLGSIIIPMVWALAGSAAWILITAKI